MLICTQANCTELVLRYFKKHDGEFVAGDNLVNI